MKRPFTLLCLSDLHLVEKQSEVFTDLRKAIKDLMEDEPEWQPDYIVMAGDMVDARCPDYDLVKRHLDSFVSDPAFNLRRFNFIAAPGNHDKNFQFTKLTDKSEKRKAITAEKRKYRSFVSKFDAEKFNFKIKDRFKENFESFGAFYSDYVKKPAKGEKYIHPKELLGELKEDVALTSGLKVFPEAMVCFLSINTEWVYLPSDSKTDSGLKKICPQVVAWCIEEYRKKYLDYALVTVMHRSPYELSWTEKNSESSSSIPDVLRMIYRYSDIILSGHDHIEKILPPHMMENRAQLFQLGTATMAKRNTSVKEVPYVATLIYMDVVEGILKLCNFKYDHSENVWEHEMGKKNYPLPVGLALDPDTRESLSSINQRNTYLTVSGKSTEPEDIIKAILRCHPQIKDAFYKIAWCNVSSVKDGEQLASLIDREYQDNEKVAFFLISYTDLDHKECVGLITSFNEKPENRERIYKQELILKELRFKFNKKLSFEE